MKFSVLASTLALCAVTCSASDDSSINVGSVIASFYPSSTPKMNGAQSTSLASAFVSVESSWYDSPAYTSAHSAILSAAPSSVQSSITKSGYYYDQIVTQSWYTKNVPHAIQTAVAGEISAIDSAAEKILGTATSSSKGAGARATGLGMAGVVGVVGGVLAAL